MFQYSKRFVAVLIIAIFCLPAVANRSQQSDDVAELSRLESVWNDAYTSGKVEPLDQLLANDLIVTMTDMATLNKAQSIGLLRSGHLKFPRYETSDIRIRVYNDAAVVTGRLQRTRTVNGNNVDDDWRFTKVYVRRSGKWQIVAWHASTSAKPNSRDITNSWDANIARFSELNWVRRTLLFDSRPVPSERFVPRGLTRG
jgi:hypothetical protein